MPFSGMAAPEQLQILTHVLDEYCLANGISDDEARKVAAARIMALFTSGFHTAEELKASLMLSSELDPPPP